MRFVLSLAVLLAACAGLARTAPTPAIISTFGCNADSVRYEWETARGQGVAIGDPLCRVIGRWGTPEVLSSIQTPSYTDVSVRWRGSPTSYVAAWFWTDTTWARRTGVRPGVWLVRQISQHQ
jgi:hypothetical protein